MKPLIRFIAVFLVFAGGVAFAHTELAESVPANKAALEQAPREIVLRFSEAVRLTALSIAKDGGEAVALRPLPDGTAKRFAVAAPGVVAGAAGAYTVEWRALAGDGHALRGSFGFAVGAGVRRRE